MLVSIVDVVSEMVALEVLHGHEILLIITAFRRRWN